MLADFFEIAKGRLELLQKCADTTKSGSLELLGTIKRIGVLEQSDVVIGDGVGDTLSFVDVAEGQFVMVTVIQDVHQIGVEWVNVIKLREAIDDAR